MTPETPRPLSAWRFDGTLRAYQADALARVDVDAGSPVHLVAPPGSGKTLLGLLLAARRGRRTVVFAPTTAIRAQWVGAARGLASSDAAVSDAAVSDDPSAPADLTALTYQAISVQDATSPFAALARRRWETQLEADDRTPEAAAEWLRALAESNPAAYRRGIRSRSRSLRRSLAREDADVLASALHPNARALLDRLVEAGVETVVLDECHHLLDHWALVVAALLARIRAGGREPLVIGLTATLPSPDDADEYDNYVSLLGEVDLEVPVPAVVREGDLAPYRDLVHVVEPTPEEQLFLSAHAEALQVSLRTTFAGGPGRAFLLDVLQPPLAAPAPTDPLAPPAPGAVPDALDRRLAAAFADDFPAAEAAAAMLSLVVPDDPVIARLPAVAQRPPTTDETLRLLGRYALDRVLPDPERADEWRRIRRVLADFGYALTDRGIRRTRDPIDTVLASSSAKDRGACDILALERREVGDDRLRALVVTDFVRHGNVHGGLLGGAGAVRTFSVLVTDAATSGLRALLVTSSTVRIAARDASTLLPALSAELGVEVSAEASDDDAQVAVVRGIGGSGIVGAASRLLDRGMIHVVVGTRGLFGEGWDCPAVNTLIDLSMVATAAATQQLRGRTLRLDPDWPEKVAHNWTVTAVLPPSVGLEAQPDAARLRRKHARLWGLDADDTTQIVRGLGAALDVARRRALSDVIAKVPGVALADVDGLRSVPPRAQTRLEWRIGEPYDDREEVSTVLERDRATPVFRTTVGAARSLGAVFAGTLAVPALLVVAAFLLPSAVGTVIALAATATGVWLAVPLGRAWANVRRQAVDAVESHRRMAEVVWESLVTTDRVASVSGTPVVTGTGVDARRVRLDVRIPPAAPEDQRTFAAALDELYGPIRSPRFVLEIDRGGPWIVRAVLDRASPTTARDFLPVPSRIARRREDAVRFAGEWRRRVGPVVLHELTSAENLPLLSEARRRGRSSAATRSMVRWR
ncbi:DEAD/DEAH box helicase family protein [Microbacterium sp. Leaf436]|uniref:DEAD/DEAH box helicase family protein n=1 Tax=Microbacterium sp. Leaf436 TaxID=1736377 RepID=UPI0006FE9375|nr:DEAD/DEAH box helicase family protein [Microbacterium sp. Leaf436]KQT74675.1 hypothetical protein ASG45_08920 [Microbacterium sp. Leaf436]